MKHILLLILLFVNILFSSTFVSQFHDKQKEVIDKLYNDGNQEELIKEKTIIYDIFLKELKEKSYGIANRITDDELNKVQFILENKIKINESKKNNSAVFRDELKVLSINIKKSQNEFYINLADILQKGRDSEQIISKRIKYMKDFNLDVYNERITLISSKEIKSKIESETVKVFSEINFLLNRENDFLSYLRLNESLYNKKDLLSVFELNLILDEINSNEFFYEINEYLNYVYLNVGKLSLLSFVLLFFYISTILINFIIKKKINFYLEKMKIVNFDFETNIKLISAPSKLFLLFFGIDFSVEILVYPNELNESLKNIFYFLHLFTLTWLIIGFIDFFLLLYFERKYQRSKKEISRTELINFLIKIIKFIAMMIALLIYLNYLQVNISTIVASLGVTSLAVALAAKDSLSNLFGSINILLDNSISQGDWIEVDGVEGTVIEIGMRSTTIRTFDNAFITVPNSKLANSAIKNWNKRKIGRRIKKKIGVKYTANRDDLVKAVEEIKQMLLSHKGIATDKTKIDLTSKSSKLIKKEDFIGVKRTLLVYFDDFNDSSLDILIYCFTRTVNWEEWLVVKQDVYLKIWEILEKNNLEIAFPTQTIEIENQKEAFKKD